MSEISVRIDTIRRQWGRRLVVLGHHYQRISVLQHADETGDSLELSRKAAARNDAERIVFCGVKFMAESADILTRADQVVYMPDTSAGCPMANMAEPGSMADALGSLGKGGGDWLPVVYVNSSAEIKAICGRMGGSTCTSSNAPRVIKWAMDQGAKVLFLPDEHLGRNTARDLGIDDRGIKVYDPRRVNGGLTGMDVADARIVVWKGFCIVHRSFTVEHVAAVRRQWPQARIIVHPETPAEVVALADAHGSTSQIISYVEQAPAGSTVVIGTELNLVERLADVHKGRVTVKALNSSVCANMAKTNEENLLRVLEDWPAGNEIHVPPAVVEDARKALERMLSL